jgi:predicted RND superfamily exporter protein
VWFARFAARLLFVQLRRPWLPVVVCVALGLAGGLLATRLELRTRFEQLLPDRQPSVVELARVQERVSVGQNVFVVLEGDDTEALRAFGDALVARLRGVGPPWVTGAEDGVHATSAFLRPRAAIFASTEALRKLKDDVDARWDWEIGEKTGSNLGDDAPPVISAAAIRARFGFSAEERFPDGYFQSKDGHALVVVVRSAVAPGELDRAEEALARVKAVVQGAAASPELAAASRIRIGYAGDLVTGLSEYGSVRRDLLSVGVLGVGLVLAVVFVFFMRVRVLVAMGLTIGVGLAWTFGLTDLAIGHLNVATGFLFSIVAGNGINFGIIYMARFYEEIRAGASPEQALRTAHASTWLSTLTAALAAAASYASLGVTAFRAFRHFAFIGSAGMLVCWVATYSMLPALLVVFERARPFMAGASEATLWGRLRLRGVRYDRPFAYWVPRAPRLIAIAGAGLAAVGFLGLAHYLRADPMEYNMRHLQNDLGGSREMYRVSALAEGVLGARLENAMVVLCDRIDQVPLLKRTLEARRDSMPDQAHGEADGGRPFEAAHTLLDFVPPEQDQKIPIALALEERLVRAHDRGLIAASDWAEIARSLPPPDLAPWTIADLPEAVARPFTERDGTRGRLVLIEPTVGKSDADLRYLLQWANAFRETRLPDGSLVRGSGRAVIFADMLEAVEADMPRAVTLSLSMTLLAVAAAFGLGAPSAAVVGALLVGLGWIAAAMAAVRFKIDFFNFIALPITFGIGVDYAVNFVQRYRADGRMGIVRTLRNAGGPIVLCSLTTMLGYFALLTSINRAVRGLGLLAVFGEAACLLAAVLVLPAALVWRERTPRAARPVSSGAGTLEAGAHESDRAVTGARG